MQSRFFKGIKISEVSPGTWQLGSADWGVVKDNEAFSILKAFTDAGGNFIDTADALLLLYQFKQLLIQFVSIPIYIFHISPVRI